MNYLHKVSCMSTPKKVESECCCEKQRKPKKRLEEIIADKQLKEIFRRELKKDIFKLCRDYDGKYFRDGRLSKSPDTSSLTKKGHFLPPLKGRGSKFRSGFRLSDLTRYGGGEDEDGGMGGDGKRFQMGGEGGGYDDDDDYNRRKYKGKHKGMHGDRHRGSRDSRSSRQRWGSHSGGTSGAGGSNLGGRSGRLGMSSSDFSSDMEGLDIGEGYGDDKDYYSLGYGNLGDVRMNYLLKYYQLKKVAAKLEERSIAIKSKRKRDSLEYEKAYKYGFTEGLKKAYYEPPIYENVQHNDIIDEDDADVSVYDDFVYEDLEDEDLEDEHLEKKDYKKQDTAYTIGVVPKKVRKTKIIYISTDEQQIEKLKKMYKDVKIKMVPDRKLASKTGVVIGQKVERYIDNYKPEIEDKSDIYAKAFRDGFVDGFNQTFIYHPTDATFDVGEKLFVNEVRKCVLFEEQDIEEDEQDVIMLKEALLDRANDLKKAFIGVIDFDAYEKEIEEKNLRKPLHFTKSDFIFFYDYRYDKKKHQKGHGGSKYLTGKNRGKFLHTGSTESSSGSRTTCEIQNDDRAWDYLNRHNIGELFRYMGIMLCSYKPEDPIDFLINLLDKCLLFRDNEVRNKPPLVFTDKHVESIYSNMDPFNYGYIDRTQYLYGLNLLEVTEPDDLALVQNTDTVEKNQFLINANDRLLEKFKTMIAIY